MGFDTSGDFHLQHSTLRFPDDPAEGKHRSSGEYTGDMRAILLCTTYLSSQAVSKGMAHKLLKCHTAGHSPVERLLDLEGTPPGPLASCASTEGPP